MGSRVGMEEEKEEQRSYTLKERVGEGCRGGGVEETRINSRDQEVGRWEGELKLRNIQGTKSKNTGGVERILETRG